MNTEDEIARALVLIEKAGLSSDRPALVVMPPDSKSFLIGNRGGLLKLAAASLRAARGEKQVFKSEPWFVVEDYDWDMAGIALDEDAHVYLPSKPTRARTVLRSIWGIGAPIAVAILLVIGLVTLISYIGTGLKHLF